MYKIYKNVCNNSSSVDKDPFPVSASFLFIKEDYVS